MEKLTAQQELFVEEHIKLRCKNATQAAINAGYSKKTASSQASQLLNNSKVSEKIKRRKSEIISGFQEELIFDAFSAKKVMLDILNNPASSDKDKITVARDFLDRAGFKQAERIEHTGEISNPFAYLTTAELKRLAGVPDGGE